MTKELDEKIDALRTSFKQAIDLVYSKYTWYEFDKTLPPAANFKQLKRKERYLLWLEAIVQPVVKEYLRVYCLIPAETWERYKLYPAMASAEEVVALSKRRKVLKDVILKGYNRGTKGIEEGETNE